MPQYFELFKPSMRQVDNRGKKTYNIFPKNSIMSTELVQSGDCGKKEVTTRQASAIRLAKKVGTELAKRNPEIAVDYRSGKTCNEIAEKYNVQGLTDEIARNAVRYALSILLAKKERNEILNHFAKIRGTNFAKQYAHEGGIAARDKKAGVHAMTSEQLSEAGKKGSRKGGLISGKKNHDNKVGIHALTFEERSRNGRESIKAALLTQGKTPWNKIAIEPTTGLNEADYCHYLSEQIEFIYDGVRGGATGRPNFKKIAERLNEVFHSGKNIRTGVAVQSHLFRLRKKQKTINHICCNNDAI